MHFDLVSRNSYEVKNPSLYLFCTIIKASFCDTKPTSETFNVDFVVKTSL